MVQIGDDDWLYRRLHPHCFKKDGSISSVTFMTRGYPDSEISVDLARLTTPQASVNRAGRPGFQLGQLQAISPRNLGLDVVHAPLEDNESHSLITGNRSKKTCKDLARLVEVVKDVRSSDS